MIQTLQLTAKLEDQSFLANLVGTFLSSKSKRTFEAYRIDLTDFQKFVGVQSISDAARTFLQSNAGEANELAFKYQHQLVEQGLQAATINRRLATLRSLSKFARIFGLISWDIEIPNLKARAYRDTRGPGLEAFRKMLAQLTTKKDPKSCRDYALLRVMYDLALRASELVQIDLDDLDLKRNALSIMGKGELQKIILSIPDSTRDVLKEWLKIRGNHPGPLFPNFDHARKSQRLTRVGLYHMVRGLGELVGVKTRPHGIRHLSITEAVKAAQANGYGLEEVLSHSRHSNVTTLMVYRDREENRQGKIATLTSNAINVSS